MSFPVIPTAPRYGDEAMLNQAQAPNTQIHTFLEPDDRNLAAVMVRGPDTSWNYFHGINFQEYAMGPMNSRNEPMRTQGYIRNEPTYVNYRPIPAQPPMRR